MDEQTADVMIDDALEAEAEAQAELGDAARKKGDGFIGKQIEF